MRRIGTGVGKGTRKWLGKVRGARVEEVEENYVLEWQEGIQCCSAIEMSVEHKQKQVFLFSDSPHSIRWLPFFTVAAILMFRTLSSVLLVLGTQFSSFYYPPFLSHKKVPVQGPRQFTFISREWWSHESLTIKWPHGLTEFLCPFK